ncbi:HNH endonuclease [Telluria beijingensis]|uniref:HNH endonuclease n=1 Tax=Telluria beijingensis TaxID=3068633 RepID=UPI00279554A6|nr:HNH endonuclease [Massilia sp. REN29]
MAQEAISKFFKRLGFPLNNDRNSWGAVSGDAILLRTWSDEFTRVDRRVIVLKDYRKPGGTTSVGLNERKEHLRALWKGGNPGYVVIITPAPSDTDGTRKIGPFRNDVVFPIERLVEEGSIFAVLGAPVPISTLEQDMQTRRVAINEAEVPAALLPKAKGEPDDADAKRAFKAAEIRDYLIYAASRKTKIRYGELFAAFDLNFRTLTPFLRTVGRGCVDSGEPILTSIVVLANGRCAGGFDSEFGVNEEAERARVFGHWAPVSAARAGTEWTDEELSALVSLYREMMQLDVSGIPFSERSYCQQLADRFGRDDGSYSHYMQNISYLLDQRGLAWLKMINPRRNVSTEDESRLLAFLEELFNELTPPLALPEEVGDHPMIIEGAKKQIVVNAYERDPTAKPRCIRRWGTICCVCDFDFGAVYGELGEGFIHVHHLNPIASIGEEYELDPENDLRPVCPNCHSMLHRRKDTLSIEELKALLRLRFTKAYR